MLGCRVEGLGVFLALGFREGFRGVFGFRV